jgi:pilus assembly protein CpaE
MSARFEEIDDENDEFVTQPSGPTATPIFDDAFGAEDDFDFPTAAAETASIAAGPLSSREDARAASPDPHPVASMHAAAEAAFGDAPVPRITIHAFCEQNSTVEAMGRAAGDRRLQKATVVTHGGGLNAALLQYQGEPTPSLVIVESLDEPTQLLAALDRLAESCDPGCKVLVVGQHNDISLYRELMRRGVSEYLVAPLNPVQVIRTISSLYSDPATPFVGRTLAFVGAKGGVGASTLAHNIAYVLAEGVQANTVVVDFDLAFGTAGLDFNQDPLQGVADALSKPDRLDEVLLDRIAVRCTDRLSLFAAPVTLDGEDFSDEAFEEVSTKIRSTAPFVVFDLPHLWTGWIKKTLLSADDVVIVATPDLACLRNAKNMIDSLHKARPNDAPPRLVLNQVGLPGRPEIPVKDFAKALGMEPALVLPFDAKLFGQAANNGQMLQDVNPKAKAAEGLLHFAHGLARREVAAAKPVSLTDRLMSRLAKKS